MPLSRIGLDLNFSNLARQNFSKKWFRRFDTEIERVVDGRWCDRGHDQEATVASRRGGPCGCWPTPSTAVHRPREEKEIMLNPSNPAPFFLSFFFIFIFIFFYFIFFFLSSPLLPVLLPIRRQRTCTGRPSSSIFFRLLFRFDFFLLFGDFFGVLLVVSSGWLGFITYRIVFENQSILMDLSFYWVFWCVPRVEQQLTRPIYTSLTADDSFPSHVSKQIEINRMGKRWKTKKKKGKWVAYLRFLRNVIQSRRKKNFLGCFDHSFFFPARFPLDSNQLVLFVSKCYLFDSSRKK